MFDCAPCNRSYECSYNLRRHVESAHREAKYKCEYCIEGSKFRLKQSLKRHIETVHLAIKLKCSQCDYQANSKSHLKIHKQSVHEKLKYYCAMCDYKVRTYDRMKRHLDLKHGNQTSNSSEIQSLEKSNCDVCELIARNKFGRNIFSDHNNSQ